MSNSMIQEIQEKLLARLRGPIDEATAEEVAEVLLETGVASQVLELLAELEHCSAKLANGAVEALPEVLRRCEPQVVIPWLDLAVALGTLSGAVTLKYFRESPQILGMLPTFTHRQQALAAALELADRESEYAANCAFELFRKTPELFVIRSDINVLGWAEVGHDLTQWNPVLGIEFFRECPHVAEVLSLAEVRPWITFGTKLITQNSLGKPDYVGILEFFRTSPSLLKEIEEAQLRPRVIALGSTLADQSPELALTFLGEIPMLLKALPSGSWQTRVLQYGALLADRDAEVTLSYLRRCPEVVKITMGSDENREAFETWFREGMQIAEYSLEGARAYFSLDTAKALLSIEQAMNGITLRQVARSLQLFARMMSGEQVLIESLPEGEALVRMEQTADGLRVLLPMVMNHFSRREENLRCYTVMVAHEIGHLEFGTYRVDKQRLQQMAQEVAVRYGCPLEHPDSILTLHDLFALYPQKGVIQDLWTILEDARVEYRLQQEYPGLGEDLAALAKASVKTRSLLHGMTAREMVVDILLLLLTLGETQTRVPEELILIIERTWKVASSIQRPQALAFESIQKADQIYQILDEMIGAYEMPSSQLPPPDDSQTDLGAGPRAAEETAGAYRAMTNFAYRGEMKPEVVKGEGTAEEGMVPSSLNRLEPLERGGIEESRVPQAFEVRDTEENAGEKEGQKDDAPGRARIFQEYWAVTGTGHQQSSIEQDGLHTYLYPEWDGKIQDYRLHWCRVYERAGPEGSPDFAQSILEKHGPSVRLLRRYFETIRPTALRQRHGYEDGEVLDLDAAITRIVERRAGIEPRDRVYVRRDKRDRQVAIAFLVDMSGSTGRQLESGSRRVMDVEKEGLVLFVEALEAIGDQYALYGFSGQGREHVDFLILKDFDETARYQIGQRIDAMRPMQQNRDGAAIRHAAWKLLQCPARHRLLWLLSDGKPLDGGYADEYALEDSKMALREARHQGIRPFCLTIDREATGYVKRMYGDVEYLVLDDVAELPERMPRVYQRLTGRR